MNLAIGFGFCLFCLFLSFQVTTRFPDEFLHWFLGLLRVDSWFLAPKALCARGFVWSAQADVNNMDMEDRSHTFNYLSYGISLLLSSRIYSLIQHLALSPPENMNTTTTTAVLDSGATSHFLPTSPQLSVTSNDYQDKAHNLGIMVTPVDVLFAVRNRNS